MISLKNLPANVYNYLAPWNVKLAMASKFIRPIPAQQLLVTRGMGYDWREPIASITTASLALSAASLIGLAIVLVACRRRQPAAMYVPAMIGSGMSASMPLVYFAIAQRYTHDMLPFLAVSAAIAVGSASRARVARPRVWLGVGLAAAAWSVLAWWQLAALYRVSGGELRISPVRDDVIVPAYERELREHPNNARIHSELGYIDYEHGRSSDARQHLEQAIALAPNDVPSLVLLATLRRASGDVTAAVDLLTRAARVSPRAAGIRGMLGGVLLSTGRTAQAVEQLRLATQLDPSDRMAQALLARALRAPP
jgi:cytochrome c-type biogenesis protein CcmH/NrfG